MRLPQPGEMFEGKYELRKLLGKGGFASVYLATDTIGRKVAIKILAPGADGYEEGIDARFMREAQVISSLRDPHTITMFDFGRADSGLLFMVFEYIDGRDVAQMIASAPIEAGAVAHILTQLLESLHEAHCVGVLHRDIKPANILVYEYMGDRHRAKLLDFGIAKPVLAAEGGMDLTRRGAVIGTPRYMAPERFFGGEVGAASDIYSLGLVAHEMLTGRPAISDGTPREILQDQVSDRVIKLPADLDVAPTLRAVVDRMTARLPQERFASASEALTALARALPAPSLTTEREVQQEQRTPSGTSTRGLAIASFGVLVLAVLVLFAWPRTTHDSPPPPVAQHIVMPRSPSATGLVISGAPVSKPDAAFEDAHVEAPAAAPTSQGCGREPGHPGRRWLSELVGLTRLKWLVYVPKGYDPNQPAPVILTFHGSYHGAPALLEESQIEPIADERGFVLIAFHSPDAEQRWEREPEGFVAAALQATGDELCLDMSRVFGLGHGTGGMFVRRLACEMHLSAMATVSSGQWDPSVECSPEPPIPYLRTAGRNDPYFPFGGGLDCREYTKTYSVAYIEDQWRQRNKCGTDRTVWRKFPTGVCYSWDCEAPLVSCHHDGGYQWPGIAPDHLNFVGCPDPIPTFPLAQTVVSFFEEQGRHRDP